MKKVLLDTNIFVAAGFNPNSSSARIVAAIRQGQIAFVWDQATRSEIRQVVHQIPPLSWDQFEDLFSTENEYRGRTNPQDFQAISDASDRKFAALAEASGAILVSNDEHLLGVREDLDIQVNTPAEAEKMIAKT